MTQRLLNHHSPLPVTAHKSGNLEHTIRPVGISLPFLRSSADFRVFPQSLLCESVSVTS